MSTLNDTDLFLVQRNGQLHQIASDQMSTLNDDDLLLVEREGVQYKIEAQDLDLGPTGSIDAPVEVLTPLNGAGVGAGTPYNPISSPIVTVGTGGSVKHETSAITGIEGSTISFSGGQSVTSIEGDTESFGTFSNTLRGLDEWGVRSNNGDSRRVDRWTFNTPIPAGRPIEVLIKGTDPAKNEVQTNNGTAASSASDVWRQIKSSSQTLEYVAVSSFFSNTVGCIIKAVRWGDTQEEFNLPADLSYESPEITLTFADSTNLDKFQVGDVVVDKEFATKTTTSTLFSGSYPTTQMYNGSEVPATTDWTLVSHTADSFIKAEGLSIPGTQIGLTIGNGFDLEIYVNGQLVDADYDPPAWNTAISTAYYTIPGGLLTSFEVKATSAAGGQGWGICSVYVDGSILIEGTSVSIVSVDPANNQMVVDGGEWDNSNQSEVWSNDVGPAFADSPAPNAFDGNLSTSAKSIDIAAGGANDKLVWTPSGGFAYTEKVEIYTPYGGGARSFFFQLNNETPYDATAAGWHTLATGSGTITSISSYWDRDYRGEIWAIRVDGKILVDAVNDSEVWSEAPYFNDNGFAFEYGNNSKMLFNGKLATSYDDGTVVPKTGGTFNLDFGTEFNDASKVKFWVWFGPNVAAENSFLINGSPVTSMTTFDALHFFEVDLPSGLQTIQWSGPNVPTNNTQTILSAIYVDGKMLVDTAARNLGDSKVSKTSTYEASLICSDDTELANMIGPISMTDGNGDLITPQTSEITNVSTSITDYTSYWTGTVYGTAGAGFDGNLITNYVYPTTNDTITWNPPGGIEYTDIKVYACLSGSPGSMKINNVDVTSALSGYDGVTALHLNTDQLAALNIQSPLNTIEITGSSILNNTPIFCGLEINGTVLIDGVTQTTLTFEDDTNLQYFQPGDVVVDTVDNRIYSDSFIEGQPNAGFPTNTFDGNAGIGSAYNNYGVVTTAERACVFDPPIEFKGGTIRVAAYSTGGSVPWVVYINGVAYEKQVAASTTLVWNELTDLPAGGIESFGMASNANAWGQVQLNGVDLIDGDGTYVQGVEVVSVDPDNSQMTVDGGKWDASNQSEVWSEAQSGNWSNARYMFDGDLASIGFGDKGQVNLPPLTAQSSIQVYFYTGNMSTAGGAADQWEVNTINISALHPNQGPGSEKLQWVDVSSAFTFPVQVQRIRTAGNNQGGVAGIKVDGKLLVDAVNDSQVWSDTTTVTGTYALSGPLSRAFDGDLATFTIPLIGNTTTVTFPSTVAGTTVEFLVSISLSANGFEVNGQDASSTFTGASGGVPVWCDVSAFCASAGGLDSFSHLYTDQVALQYIHAIRVDGELLVDQGVRDLGDTFVSLPPLEASATDVIGVDGNTLQIDGVAGTWQTGLYIKGASISSSAPSADSIVFTSSNGGTTEFTGADATLSGRVWTLEKSSSQTGPWTLVGEYTDLDANASQDGATPWSTTKPTLEAGTYYQVKVQYTSNNADPVESIYSTFKTGDAY